MENANVKGSWPGQEAGGPEPKRNQCCFLCQSAHRKLCRIFAAENLKSLIRKYLEIKILPDMNELVCVDCIEKLKSLRWFALQGRKNDTFLKSLPNELLPQEDKYCRLCLATNDNLQAIFIENTQQHSNSNVLCQLLKECISIELDYHRDFTSYICALCRTQLEMFVTFKRIAQQMQHETTNDINLTGEKNGVTEVNKEIDTPTAFEPVLKEMNDHQSDEPVQKKRRKRRTKAEMALARAQGLCKQPKPKEDKKEKHKTHTKAKSQIDSIKESPAPQFMITEDNGLALNDRRRTIRVLWMADDERNFEVIKVKGGGVRVRMDGFGFFHGRTNTDGTSLWHCEYKIIHNCRFEIVISANGKMATVSNTKNHTHDKNLTPLLNCPLGKGRVLNSDGTEDTIWLVDKYKTCRHVERHLIYRGHRYGLRGPYEEKDISLWDCRVRHCNTTIKVIGIFEEITVLKGTHNHPEITDQEWRDALKDSKVSMHSQDVITPFRSGKTEAKNKTALPKIYAQLSTADQSRDFEVIKLKESVYKIKYQGYDYKLYLKQQDGSTLWKCIWDGLHGCKAVIVVSDNGKTAAYYGLDQHSHPEEPGQIFECDPQQYSVRNIASDAMESITLLARECKYFRSRTIFFRSNLYNLYQIVNDESRWSCIRTDSFGQQCIASLMVTGKMESFLQKGVHCHMPVPKSDIKSIIKPGNILDLSALKQNDHSTTTDTVQPGSSDDVLEILKRQLFTYPMGRGSIWDKSDSRNIPFYFVKDQPKNNETPYKFFFQQYRYAFASIDEYGISQWICCQLLENSALAGTCTARVTIEGVFQRVAVKGYHNHEGISQSLVEYLCSRSEQR